MNTIPLGAFAVPLLIFSLLFYIQESSDETPNLVRAGTFLLAAVEAVLSMALAS